MKKKNPHAMALGKMGGSKGGRRRAAKLTLRRGVQVQGRPPRRDGPRKRAIKGKQC